MTAVGNRVRVGLAGAAAADRRGDARGGRRGSGLAPGRARRRELEGGGDAVAGTLTGMTRVAVVGHVEWVEFARVPRLPAAGEIVHASE